MAVKEMSAEARGKSRAGRTTATVDTLGEIILGVVEALNFEPVLDYIVVADIEGDEVIIAPGQREGHVWGRVLAVGPGRPSEYSGEPIYYPAERDHVTFQHPNVCQEGQRVLYSRGAGTPIPIDGMTHRFLLPRDILARRGSSVQGVMTDPAAIAESDAEFYAAERTKDELRGS